MYDWRFYFYKISLSTRNIKWIDTKSTRVLVAINAERGKI